MLRRWRVSVDDDPAAEPARPRQKGTFDPCPVSMIGGYDLLRNGEELIEWRMRVHAGVHAYDVADAHGRFKIVP
jgi:hypothetical protein